MGKPIVATNHETEPEHSLVWVAPMNQSFAKRNTVQGCPEPSYALVRGEPGEAKHHSTQRKRKQSFIALVAASEEAKA